MSYTPVVSGYAWKDAIVSLIRSEQAEVETVQKLLKVASTPDTCRLLAELLATKINRISTLHELLNYQERG